MDTHTFDNYSVTCPICQRIDGLKLVKMCDGLFTCPYCQELLVVTWSGHYVRDPYNCKQVMIAQVLRRKSRPLARILRDFGNLRRPSLLVAVGSAILFSVSFITLASLNSKHQPFQGLLNPITHSIDPPQNR